ncbi:DUF2625 domain-containing protein [Knoellia locipacati]|uniref:DUF2625 family protein n=1 Tax=Knoellia locipacati TaxID=882824 RepID=UPI00384AA7A7
MTRSVEQLVDVDSPTWPQLVEATKSTATTVEVLPVTREQGERTLHRLQVTTHSALGALALECGGLLVDHGWLRILGGGHDGIPDLATANGLDDPSDSSTDPPHLLVALDVLGGRFAIDGGGLGVATGQVCYFAPDSLQWDSLDIGHTAFVHAMIGGATERFYDGQRWPGWQEECARLASTEGFALYPPPFTVEGQDLSAVSRGAVPMDELLGFYDDAAGQLSH